MVVLIAKSFDFDAAHMLPKVPPEHKCHRLHGHTYRVEIRCAGEPDERGMVCDYAEIAEAWQSVHELLDHRYLNDIQGLENPTTEMLAPWILERLRRWDIPLISVRVYESASTWCEVLG